MIRAIDRTLAVIDGKEEGRGDTMTANDIDMKQIFDGFDPSDHEAEAKQRWGHTDAYKESMKRTKSYTKEDWQKLKDDQASIYGDAVLAMKAGRKPEDEAVMDIAERHRLSIDRWFYPCSVVMHMALADMYESDRRFSENIDQYGEGLTGFLSEAIRANGSRNRG